MEIHNVLSNSFSFNAEQEGIKCKQAAGAESVFLCRKIILHHVKLYQTLSTDETDMDAFFIKNII